MRKLFYAAALVLAASPVLAADVTSAWIRQLSIDGYDKITISNTWLGRKRILAEKGAIEREIIINPRTGEVLRDYSRDENGKSRLPLGFDVELDDEQGDGSGNTEGQAGSGDGNEGHGNGDDGHEDDGHEDDGHEDDGHDDGGEDDEEDNHD
ncbi:MAG: hypothetical protein LJE68_00095 [Rhodobacter sp.]|nr:hypothetical protein [Rhodobacter sp.]